MSSQLVIDAFKTALTAQFPTVPLIDIINESPEYPVDAWGRPLPFMALFGLGTEERTSIGAPNHACWREMGNVNIAFYYPTGLGANAPRELADQVRGVLRGRSLPTIPAQRHVQIKSVDPLTNMTDKEETAAGAYYVAAVSAHYQFDFTG